MAQELRDLLGKLVKAGFAEVQEGVTTLLRCISMHQHVHVYEAECAGNYNEILGLLTCFAYRFLHLPHLWLPPSSSRQQT